MKSTILLLTGLAACSLMSGCLVLGYSSGGGFFIWPGALGLLVILVLWLVFRGR